MSSKKRCKKIFKKKVQKSEKKIFCKKGKIFSSANEKYFRRRTKNSTIVENGINGKKGEKPGEKKEQQNEGLSQY